MISVEHTQYSLEILRKTGFIQLWKVFFEIFWVSLNYTLSISHSPYSLASGNQKMEKSLNLPYSWIIVILGNRHLDAWMWYFCFCCISGIYNGPGNRFSKSQTLIFPFKYLMRKAKVNESPKNTKTCFGTPTTSGKISRFYSNRHLGSPYKCSI